MKLKWPGQLLIVLLRLTFLAAGCAPTGVKRVGMVAELHPDTLDYV